MSSMLVHKVFEEQARKNPDAIAIETKRSKVTFKELEHRANRIANLLIEKGVQPKSLVGILLESELDMIASMIAVLKIGCCYTPIDPNMPATYQESVVESSRPVLILTKRAYCIDVSVFLHEESERKLLMLEECLRENADEVKPVSYDGDGKDNAYVLFTSGTTGVPNGAVNHHNGLCNLTSFCRDCFGLGPGVRILQYATVSFDAMVFEVFNSLLSGSTLCLSSREEMLPGKPLATTLQELNIQFLCIPPSAIAGIDSYADKLPNLKTIVVAGEKCPTELVRTWLVGDRALYNAYGPTETTVCATIHKCVEEDKLSDNVPIGKPLPGFVLEVVNENGEQVNVGEVGELLIGGIGVSYGYIGKENLTRERFSNGKFYTRDRVTVDKNGVYRFVARADNMVKHRGYRIELEAIEAAIMDTGLVSNAIVVKKDALVAYITAKNKDINNDELVSTIQRKLSTTLPSYMQPSRYEIMDVLPMMPNGSKVDRKALELRELNVRERSSSQSGNRLVDELVNLFADHLNRNVSPHETLAQMGGNSMDAVALTNKINNKYGFNRSRITVSFLYKENTNINSIAKVVARKLENMDKIQNEYELLREDVDYLKEALIDEDIDPVSPTGDELVDEESLKEITDPTRVMNIFVSGGTGFLGGQVIAELLMRTKRTHIYALARSKDGVCEKDRVLNNVKRFKNLSEEHYSRISVVSGDLGKKLFGLSKESFEDLARTIDVIYHVGADISYVKSYAALRDVNVGGTHEMIRLAAMHKLKPLHHVSSVCIYGAAKQLFGWDTLLEDHDYMENLDYLYLENGYTKSKWISEHMVWSAKEKGIPVKVYRPGFIESPTDGAASNPADFLCRMLKGCVQLGVYPDLPYKYWLFTPADYIASAIVMIGHFKYRSCNKDRFHLAPVRSREISCLKIFQSIAAMGYNLKPLPLREWLAAVASLLDNERTENALYGVAGYLTEKIYKGRYTILEIHHNSPKCGCHNTEEALMGTGIECLSFNSDIMQRYIRCFVNQKWFPEQVNSA
jgi:amino acid adenylation domain-containing protein/thioester reductase-like protein